MNNIWIPILSIMVVIYIVIGTILIRFLRKSKKNQS